MSLPKSLPTYGFYTQKNFNVNFINNLSQNRGSVKIKKLYSLHVNSYVEKGKRIMGQSSMHKGSFFQAVNSAGREETNIPCGCAIKV